MASEPETELDEALGALSDPGERFLARVLWAALSRGWRTPDDFVKHFTVDSIVRALDGEPELRARILVDAIGIPEKIAQRCSTTAAIENLEIALEEGVTDAYTVLDLVPLAARVQRLSGEEIWRFSIQGFVDRAASASQRQTREVERLAVVLEAALAEQLIGLSDIASTARVEELAKRISDAELRRAFALAVESALDNQPVRENAIADLLDVRSLIEGADSAELWDNVVVERIIRPQGLTSGSGSMVRERGIKPRSSPQLRILPPPENIPRRVHDDVTKLVDMGDLAKAHSDVTKRVSMEDLKRAHAQATLHTDLVPPPEDITIELGPEDEVDDLTDPRYQLVVQRGAGPRAGKTGPGERGKNAEGSRRAALSDALREIGRLPRNHEYLSIPILHSIGKMYREMRSQRSKTARAQAIKDAFDNDAHLRVGLLALIELIDPHTDLDSARDATSDALIDMLLAQEHALWERAKARGNVKPRSEPLRGRLPSVPPPRR